MHVRGYLINYLDQRPWNHRLSMLEPVWEITLAGNVKCYSVQAYFPHPPPPPNTAGRVNMTNTQTPNEVT